MLNLELVKTLQKDPRYQFARAWENITNGTPEFLANRLGHGLTSQTLQVPGGIATQPAVFTDPVAQKSIAIVHVGRRITGFPMIVHGGILAALLDEALGRVAHLALGAATVTANLKMDYLGLTIAHQFIVLRTECDKIDEVKRKAFVSGTVETLKGKILVKSSGLFVVPKQITLTKHKMF